MATVRIEKEQVISKTQQVIGDTRFDWTMIALYTWLMIGFYSDAWAHNHLRLDSFFTPWHGTLYSGIMVVMIFLVGSFIRNRLRGYTVPHALPAGYELSLFGVILFFLAGIGDMFWHILFGIELNLDGALSPTHLTLIVAASLILTGPFRAAWCRIDGQKRPTFITLLPMIISLTYFLATISLLAQVAHPFVNLWASQPGQSGDIQVTAVAGMIVQTTILMGLLLVTMRRWALPFGTCTLLFTVNIAALSIMQDHYQVIPAAILAGLFADVLIWRLRPSITRLNALRLFAFAVPVMLYLLYFLTLVLTTGVNWTIHLWLGSTVVAGLTGWLLSYLLMPPALPTEAASGHE